MKKAANVFLGLATIFAAGAIVGILYAPDKGDRTRRMIARKSRGAFNTVNDAIEEGKDSLQEIRDRLKDDLVRIDDEIEKLKRGS